MAKRDSENLKHLLYERSMRMATFASLGSRRNRSLNQRKINKFKAHNSYSDFTSLVLYDYGTYWALTRKSYFTSANHYTVFQMTSKWKDSGLDFVHITYLDRLKLAHQGAGYSFSSFIPVLTEKIKPKLLSRKDVCVGQIHLFNIRWSVEKVWDTTRSFNTTLPLSAGLRNEKVQVSISARYQVNRFRSRKATVFCVGTSIWRWAWGKR